MTTSHKPKDRSVNSSLLKAHTPGRLEVINDIGSWSANYDGYGSTAVRGVAIEGGPMVALAVEHNVNLFSDPDPLNNARRLVACWNYAETLGMSTEEIELAEQPVYSRRKLEAERGELLEALRRIEGATMSMYATRSDMLEDCQDIARAAIQKAEGEA